MGHIVGRKLRECTGPILITGHTGFKGTWLTFLLDQLEIPSVGLSLPAIEGSLFDRSVLQGVRPEVFLDIQDYESVSRFINSVKPSVIFHLAAQPLVLESYSRPLETFSVNVMGTANVLDIASKTDFVKAVVVATTDKVYRNNETGIPFVEGDPLGGKDPYSASKVAAEAVVSAWQQIVTVKGGPKIVGVRAGNVIGGGDWAVNRLIPDLARGLMTKTTVNVRNPESTRPWQHVLDPLMGYVMTAEALLTGENLSSLNFGPAETSMQVSEVVRIVEKIWPDSFKVEFSNTEISRGLEAQTLGLNSNKARHSLGWTPVWSQQEAVILTAQWWKEVIINGLSPADVCRFDSSKFLKEFGSAKRESRT